jgi:hypothetical protein
VAIQGADGETVLSADVAGGETIGVAVRVKSVRAKSVALVRNGRNERNVPRRIGRLHRSAISQRAAAPRATVRKGQNGHAAKVPSEAAAVAADAPGRVVRPRLVMKLSRNTIANVPRGKNAPPERNVRTEVSGRRGESDPNDRSDRVRRNRLGRMLNQTRLRPATMMNLEWASGRLPLPAADAAVRPRSHLPPKRANAAPDVAVVADVAMRKTK